MTIRTPSRLHFGLLSWGGVDRRQFGGVGLMVNDPGLEMTLAPSDQWQANGSHSRRVLEVAARVAERLVGQGFEVAPARLTIRRSPLEHVGLGVGTQLGLGVARLISERAGKSRATAAELAEMAGRGLRSGVGLHGFVSGGLIVDGGRRGPEGSPPLLSRLTFPEEWSILVVIPPESPGLHGPSEIRAFAELPPVPDTLVDRLCRLVLMGVLPAVAERDLARFSEALEELQTHIGKGFAPAQGGIFARPELEVIARWLRSERMSGVGQSSWGPTLYAFTDASRERQLDILARLVDRFGLPPDAAFWTTASPQGAILSNEPS